MSFHARILFCFVAILFVVVAPARAQWFQGLNKIYYTDGNVGIGTPNPNSSLTVTSADGSADRPALQVKMTHANPGPFNSAIRGINRGLGIEGIGVWGSHDANGTGVLGSTDGNGFSLGRGICSPQGAAARPAARPRRGRYWPTP